MQSSPLECGKIRFDQIEPRGIGGRPIDVDTPANSGGKFPQGLLVGAEVVPDKVYTAPGPEGKHVLQPKRATAFSGFRGEFFADGNAGLRTQR